MDAYAMQPRRRKLAHLIRSTYEESREQEKEKEMETFLI